MNIVVTNMGASPVPFTSSSDKGFAHTIGPNESFSVDVTGIHVANIGDNPTWTEEVAASLKHVFAECIKLIAFWRDTPEVQDSGESLSVRISNKGKNDLRVLLGSNVDEVLVTTGSSHDLVARTYIEIREQGV